MRTFTLLFPLWALLAAAIAWLIPDFFASLKGIIFPLLMVVMLAMGMTLSLRDFQQVWGIKQVALIGVVIQFLIMPLAAFIIAKLMQLPLDLTIGMLLVGVTAGGTASNVMTYLAGGNLALSVSMTFISSISAVLLMPLLTELYLGQVIDVPVAKMLMSMVQLVILPIAVGIMLNHFAARRIAKVQQALATIASGSIVLIIAIVVAVNHDQLEKVSLALLLAVMIHNLVGLLVGYQAIKWLGYDSITSRTVAIEVAMQNSGLSVAMALNYFSALAALPGALFSVWHNVSGALFASYWRKKMLTESGSNAKLDSSVDRK